MSDIEFQELSDFTPLREAVDTRTELALPPAGDDLKRRATVRGRRRVALVLATTAAVVAGAALTVPLIGLDDDRRTVPAQQPKSVESAVPVWYDAKGLHRGDVVEQTPVAIMGPGRNDDTLKGALALVRSGAVYLDRATGNVWFHPWGGEPRIVGHNSQAGPGGDPNGDFAAWFEGSKGLEAGPGELVVYDTAAGREISRTFQSHGVDYACCEHRPPGNNFLQVSAERVVWTSDAKSYSHDVRTRTTSVVVKDLADVHDEVEALSNGGSLVLRVPGRAEESYPDLEGLGRLSPSGNYLLAVEQTEERHAAVIVDTRTGELWRVPKNVYPWIAWSYGDIAMVDHTEDELLACDAARRACERVPAERPFLVPTN